MNIIIPLGGTGTRFKNNYSVPKPLIHVFNKNILSYVIDHLDINEEDKIFIIYNYDLDNYDFTKHIKNKYLNINFIKLNKNTSGASETLLIGTTEIINNHKHYEKCLIIDGDTFYTDNIIKYAKENNENIVFYRNKENEEPIFSYVEIDRHDNKILKISEKNKISNNANTGAYGFKNIYELNEYCNFVVNNNIKFNNECYTSCVISEMIKSNKQFIGIEINDKNVFSLGTPKELDNFIKNAHFFLFDMDGTLIITDDIYYEVWTNILKIYNIDLTHEIFKKYIQGNNDKYVINTLLTGINVDLNEISQLKDDEFIKNINKIMKIKGIHKIFNKIKNNGDSICIVTNCNKKVANEIVKHINIDKYIDFIISGDDVKHGKPHSEPYINAIKKFNTTSNKCVIFEDSKSGILSAKSVIPLIIVGINTIYDNETLCNYGVDIAISNFENFDIYDIIKHTQHKINNMNNTINILKHLEDVFNTKNIILNECKYKGGNISDVISFKVINKNCVEDYILKLENIYENDLSKMATKLDLYEREYYFYTNISKYTNIKIPKFIDTLKDNNFNNIGIILENMITKGNFTVNLNLNNEDINLSLKIINEMVKMHVRFWNADLKKMFPKINKNNDEIFKPFLENFIAEKFVIFKKKWENIIGNNGIILFQNIALNFGKIQNNMSENNLTFVHGDIKSPNIFYDKNNNNEPYFIDWQHCVCGKGVQDLVFFMIESFDIEKLDIIVPLFKNYYYIKLIENEIKNYSFEEYEKDFQNAICYIPFFTAIWFGSIPLDELIDKNFPYFLIQKLNKLICEIKTINY